MILFNDIGSYPLPKNITKDWVSESIKKDNPVLFKIIRNAMWQKISAGVDIPTYPQFQDMNQQFLSIINDESMIEGPLLVRKDKARIVELEALEDIGMEYYKVKGKILDIRLCITGPVELYLKQFGGTTYKDILNTIAISIDRFIENSVNKAKHFKITDISIDEPSIGINPQIMFNDNDLIEALKIATKTATIKEIDTEIHLHSPLYYKIICRSPIGIIGVESAASPSYLDLIDKKDLEEYNKFLRVGISRTDIFNMAAMLNEKYNTNVWKETSKLEEITNNMETSHVIEKRLEKVYKIFGDRIKYTGPDCGLGSWPTQELAFNLLKNTGIGIQNFLKNQSRI